MPSNITHGPLARTAVLDELKGLHARLEHARAAHDHDAVVLARYEIDSALERLTSIASEAEFGRYGVAPT